jgi:hypothetical protein
MTDDRPCQSPFVSLEWVTFRPLASRTSKSRYCSVERHLRARMLR